jgi:integrase
LRRMTENKVRTETAERKYFAKTDLRYWREKIDRRGHDYSVQIQFAGRREKINLRLANAEQAAAKARDLYLSLLRKGWEPTLLQFKAGYAEPPRIDLSIGEYVEAIKAQTAIRRQTIEGYATALRTIASGISGLADHPDKFHPSRQWREKVEALQLGDLTNERIEMWRLSFVKRAGSDPLREKAARNSANAFLRRARALFGKKIVPSLRGIVLPSPLPFAGIKIEQVRPPRYRASFDAVGLAIAAREELATEKPEQYKIFLLGLMAGLRRNEIDKLPWSAFDFERSEIHIENTPFFRAKTDDSNRPIPIDSELAELFRGHYLRRTGEFVIESDETFIPNADFDSYRCDRDMKELLAWLRLKGVKSRTPLHALRKEFGSQICAQFGIYAAQVALGHSDPKVTAMHYLEPKKRAVLGFGHLLAPQSNVVAIPKKAAS